MQPAPAVLAPHQHVCCAAWWILYAFSAVCPSIQGYTFLKGMDSLYGDLAFLGGMSVEQLAAECSARHGCKGFTSSGMLKDRLRQVAERTELISPGPCDGLYIKSGATPDGKCCSWLQHACSGMCRHLALMAAPHPAHVSTSICFSDHQSGMKQLPFLVDLQALPVKGRGPTCTASTVGSPTAGA